MFWPLGGPQGTWEGQNYMFQAGQLHFDLVEARTDPRFDFSERAMTLLSGQEFIDCLPRTDFPKTI